MKQALTLLALLSLPWSLVAEPKTWATSAPFGLDINSGTRETAGDETLAYDSNWYANGSKIAYKISVNGKDLAQGDGCGEVNWETHRPGVYEVVASAYEDGVLVDSSLTATFEFKGKDLVNADVAFVSDENILYDGTAKTPSVSVALNGETLVEGVDYELGYEENVQPGVGKVVVRGKGRFSDEIEVPFTIVPAGICSLDIESGVREAKAVEALTYDGLWKGSADADYRIWIDGAEHSAGSGCGEAIWTPRAVGDHVATYRTYVDGAKVGDDLSAKFHVSGHDLVNASVKLNEETILYDGTAREPKATITYEGKTLVEGEDYELSYRDNIESGTGILTITGKGEFVDIVDVPFTIRPAGICTLDIESGYRQAKAEELLAFDYKWKGGALQGRGDGRLRRA